MPKNKTEKPKIDLEKLVDQFKVGVAVETGDTNIINYAFNDYHSSPDRNEELKKYVAQNLAAGIVKPDMNNYLVGLASIYQEGLRKLTVGQIKEISKRLDYEAPNISNLVADNVKYKDLDNRYTDIIMKQLKAQKEDKKYELTASEQKIAEAVDSVKQMMDMYKQKTLVGYQERKTNDVLKARNEKYKPVKKAA